MTVYLLLSFKEEQLELEVRVELGFIAYGVYRKFSS